jgi:hypothetical protein
MAQESPVFWAQAWVVSALGLGLLQHGQWLLSLDMGIDFE